MMSILSNVLSIARQFIQSKKDIEPATVSTSMISVANDAFAKNGYQAEKTPRQWGEVVVLVGSSTAGKSTLISKLIEQKPQMIDRGVDWAFLNIPLNYLNNKHAKEMAFLERVIEPTENDKLNHNYLVNYIDPINPNPHFKENVSNEDQYNYQRVVKHLNQSINEILPGNHIDYQNGIIIYLVDEIIDRSKKGLATACDFIAVHEVALELLKIVPSVKFALVYVPFEKLAERIIERNNTAFEGDKKNARVGIFPLEQYAKLFRPAVDSSEKILDTLTFKQMKNAIETVYENCKNFCDNEDSLQELNKQTVRSAKIIYAKFGFNENDQEEKTINLTPNDKNYQKIINTADPSELEKGIQFLLKNK